MTDFEKIEKQEIEKAKERTGFLGVHGSGTSKKGSKCIGKRKVKVSRVKKFSVDPSSDEWKARMEKVKEKARAKDLVRK